MNPLQQFLKALSPIWGRDRGSGWPIIREPYTGAWQQNAEITKDELSKFHAVFACVTLIANDIAKLPIHLVAKDANGIWTETENAAYSPVLTRPNRYQNRIQFIEHWVLSVLLHGQCTILKRRDRRNVVVELYILDPSKVRPLLSESGEVFWELSPDSLSKVREQIVVPATEIISDRINTLFHPLIGVSPLAAASLSVTQGREIQTSAVAHFANAARPAGMLTAPGAISDETAQQIREHWKSAYSGKNAGRVAVLADGLTYSPFPSIDAASSQMIEQLRWSAEVVCSVFHVPHFMVGGDLPSYDSVEMLTQAYYGQCLQARIEAMELALDEGLNVPRNLGVEFALEALLRLDAKALIEAESMAIAGSIKTTNEARRRLNLPPVLGGDSVLSQQQYYSLEALAKRDARPDPFANDNSAGDEEAKTYALIQNVKGLAA